MKTVLIPTLVAAKNIDTLNRSFQYSTADLENGSVFQAGTATKEVYSVVKPVTGKLNNLWMACSPEDTIITDAAGNQYKPGINNPTTFTNVAGMVFSAFKLQAGDLITITDAGIDDTYATGDTYLIAKNDSFKFAFADDTAAATAITAGTTALKIVDASAYISIAGLNAIGSQRAHAYLVEVVQN